MGPEVEGHRLLICREAAQCAVEAKRHEAMSVALGDCEHRSRGVGTMLRAASARPARRGEGVSAPASAQGPSMPVV